MELLRQAVTLLVLVAWVRRLADWCHGPAGKGQQLAGPRLSQEVLGQRDLVVLHRRPEGLGRLQEVRWV